MRDDNIYERIVEEYIEKRTQFITEKFIQKRWNFFKSYWKRAIGKKDEFRRLRYADMEFQNNFEKYLKKYLDNPDIKIDDLKDYIVKLKNHSLKLNYRLTILPVVLSCILFLFTLFKLYDEIIALVSIFFIIIPAFNEQIKLKEYQSAYEEFYNILDRFIKN